MSSIAQPKQEYYEGFDMRMREVFRGELFDTAKMTPAQRKGYNAACRAEADADTASYLVGQGRKVSI